MPTAGTINYLARQKKSVTDDQGRAWVKYPVNSIPEEKEDTGALILMVTHPEFASVHVQTYLVDGSGSPIQIHRGLLLRFPRGMATTGNRSPEVVFNLSQEGLNRMTGKSRRTGRGAYINYRRANISSEPWGGVAPFGPDSLQRGARLFGRNQWRDHLPGDETRHPHPRAAAR